MFFKPIRKLSLSTAVGSLVGMMAIGVPSAVSLPPPQDTPEEVLRTEIILEARSPVNGKPLSAAEYAQLQAQLASSPPTTQISPNLKEKIFLLRLRKLLRTFIPFLPI